MASMMDLAVSLTAKTGRFNAGFRKAEKRVGSFSGKMKRVTGALLKYGGLIASVAGVAGLGLMVRKSMQSVDAAAKLSDQLGIATEKLQGLRHAAEITGAGTAAMDKGLSFMSKSLGEAKQGIGEAKQALAALDLTVEGLLSKRPDEQFRIISDRMGLMATQSEKAFVATKLFGRGGLGLINTLALGTRGLDAMQAEAEKLGIAFNRVDAAKVEAANDAITRMKSVFTGIANTLAINLAPFVDTLATKFTDLATEGEGMGVKVAGAFKSVVMAVIRAGMEIKTHLSDILRVYGEAANALGQTQKLGTMGIMGDTLQQSGLDAIKAAAMMKATQGDAAKMAEQFFDDIINSAQKKAEGVVNAKKKELAGVAALENMEKDKAKRGAGKPMTQFQTTSLRRFAIDGLVGTRTMKKQNVKDTYLGAKIDRLINVVSNKSTVATLG